MSNPLTLRHQQALSSLFNKVASVHGFSSDIIGGYAFGTLLASIDTDTADVIPSQDGEGGKFLKTDGTNMSWAAATVSLGDWSFGTGTADTAGTSILIGSSSKGYIGSSSTAFPFGAAGVGFTSPNQGKSIVITNSGIAISSPVTAANLTLTGDVIGVATGHTVDVQINSVRQFRINTPGALYGINDTAYLQLGNNIAYVGAGANLITSDSAGDLYDFRFGPSGASASALRLSRDVPQGWLTLSTVAGGAETSIVVAGLGGAAVNRIGLQGNAFAMVTQGTATLTVTSSLAAFGVAVDLPLATVLSVGAPIAAAATVAPTAPVTHITGHAAAIATITPPAGFTASGKGGVVMLVFDDALATWSAAGNIAVAGAATTANSTVTFTYDNATSKWYPSRVA